MNTNLRIILCLLSFLLLFTSLRLVSRNKLPIKYSLFWILSSLIIFLVSIFPNFIGMFTRLFGFETSSNFIIGVILVILLIITLLLTIIVSNQKKQIKLLIQEVSMLKKD